MADKTEVKATLTFDTNAQKVLKEVQGDLKALQTEVKQADNQFEQFGTHLKALFTHDILMTAVRGARDMVTSAIGVGAAAYDAEQHIAGMMAGMSGTEWDTARGGAEVLSKKLTDVAISTGQAKEEIQQAHQVLRTFLGGGANAFDVATNNIQNLTTIANVTGLNLNELGMQFGKMAAGFVSMESPVYNLLKKTGIFASDITKVVPEWQKLTETERIQRLETAVGGVAKNLSAAGPTFTDLLTSVKETGTAFMESFGGALLREVIDELSNLRGEINSGGEEFDKFAKTLGKDFGKELAQIIDQLIDAAEYLRENGDEIAENIREAFVFAKETIKFLVDHAGLFAGIAGAGMLARNGTVQGVVKGAFAKEGDAAPSGMAEQAGALAAKYGGQLAKQALPALTAAFVAGGPPIWAATAAVTAMGGAFIYMTAQGNKEKQLARDRIDEIMKKERDRYHELHELSEEEHTSRSRDMKEMITLAKELGDEVAVAKKFKGISARNTADVGTHVQPFTTAGLNYELMVKQGASEEAILKQRAQAVEDMSEGLRQAVLTGDTDVTKALLKTMMDNIKLRDAFLNAADTVSIGSDGIRTALQGLEEMGATGGILHKFFSGELKSLDMPKGVAVNLNGGQKFEIQQDFRDQDPDAVAVAFHRDITRAAVSRVQASTAAPFGA